MASEPLGWMVHILLFLACMAFAGIANRTTLRPVWNGALIYIILATLWTVFLLIRLHSDSSRVPEHLRAYVSGQIIAEPFLVVLVAIYYAQKFMQDHRASPPARSDAVDEMPAWLRDEPKKKPWWKP